MKKKKQQLQVTSHYADFSKYKDYLLGEDRYRSLQKLNKNADNLLDTNKENAEARYNYYKSLEKSEE